MKRCLAFLLLAVLTIGTADGQDKKKQPKKPNPVHLDPQKAGVDFGIQGEYDGTVGKDKFGAQVVALGDGKFDVYLLRGGLPGAGWDGKSKAKISAALDTDATISSIRANLMDKTWTGTITFKGKLTLRGKGATEDSGALNRVERKSPTLGMKPPESAEGAIVLFDGSNANEWSGGKLVEGDLLHMGVNSKKKFKDLKLHLEFRTPFQPYQRGQGRGNSGVYLQARHEIQVLDSFGLKGLNNECGGIYGHTAPSVNMCFPPLSWQTYDIDYKAPRFENGKKIANPRVTVRHNGVLIHDNVEIKDSTKTDAPGHIHLQNHGNPVYYRNIWVVVPRDGQ